jgi:hypothetical protein
MPRVTQYIREEDMDKWKAIKNKSEFIHNALKDVAFWTDGKHSMNTPGPVKELYDNKPIKTIEANEGVVLKPVKLCKHNANPLFCKHAKPGKPCK